MRYYRSKYVYLHLVTKNFVYLICLERTINSGLEPQQPLHF